MKQMFKLILAISFAGILFACNNNSADKKDEAKVSPDSSAKATAAPAPTGPTLPMDVVTIYHTVKDYKTWRMAFDGDTARRKEAGFSFVAVERAAENLNNVKIVLAVSDLAKAKAFPSDPGLKVAMDKGGVISKPEMKFWKIVRFSPDNQKTLDTRLEIVHKVKNYDAWLKVYDAEGAATRSANGMNDIALGRGIDDSTLVHIVFEITDMSKVKARLADPAFKKIMMDAGVEGKPSFTFYKDASK
ncbi:MAG: hypothetical protein WCR66_05560 [Bacteroidota bacterium]